MIVIPPCGPPVRRVPFARIRGAYVLVSFALSSLVLAPASFAATWPAGSTINPGVSVDITKEGFDAVAALIPDLLPPSIPVGDISDGYAGLFDQCWAGGYEYGISNAEVELAVAGASITPGDGRLDIRADLMVSLNDASNPFSLYTMLECIEGTCEGYVEPFPVSINTYMMLSVIDDGSGGRTLDATVGEIIVEYEIDGAEDISLGGCAIGDIEEVLNYVGISLYDLILGLVGGTLDSTIADLAPTLEETIEDAFSSATIEQELALGESVVTVKLQPSNVEITPASLRLWMEGSFSGDAATCIAAYDAGGSNRTDSELPGPTELPNGVPSDYHAGVLVGDDFANAALYSLWRSGLLCYTLDEGGPVPLDTSILSLLTDGAFEPLFPEVKPMVLVTRPQKPPEVVYTGENDLGLNVQDLGLDFFAELDGRQARVVSLALDVDAGADLAFNGTTGELEIAVDLDPNKIIPSVEYNEIQASANDAILAQFGGLFQTILDTVVGGLLEDLAFALPSFSGVGLQSLQVSANGADGDWLGVYAWLGPVEYTGGDSSCGSCGGCGGDTGASTDTGGGDCSSGLSCAAGPFAPWTAVGLAALVARRRRA